jgi:SET domain-containing protein
MPASKFRVGRSETGLGLFATKPIKKSAYIATYRGRRISSGEAEELEQRGSRYMFELNSRWVIDGSPRYNVARYMNHSCRPNAEPFIRKGRKIVFKARRAITAGEEITYNYGRDYFNYFIKKNGCRCLSCRKKADLRRSKKKTRKT